MTRLYCVMAVLLMLAGTISCTNKEQVYEGLYNAFSSFDETRRTENPSYNSVQARDKNDLSYQKYKRERELFLDESNTPYKKQTVVPGQSSAPGACSLINEPEQNKPKNSEKIGSYEEGSISGRY